MKTHSLAEPDSHTKSGSLASCESLAPRDEETQRDVEGGAALVGEGLEMRQG